jgi:hypothetical protein
MKKKLQLLNFAILVAICGALFLIAARLDDLRRELRQATPYPMRVRLENSPNDNLNVTVQGDVSISPSPFPVQIIR